MVQLYIIPYMRSSDEERDIAKRDNRTFSLDGESFKTLNCEWDKTEPCWPNSCKGIRLQIYLGLTKDWVLTMTQQKERNNRPTSMAYHKNWGIAEDHEVSACPEMVHKMH